MDPLVIAGGLAMILLHRADGGEVVVVPSHVTALHARPPDGRNRVAYPEARCVVWLSDGKQLSVLETCQVVRDLLKTGP